MRTTRFVVPCVLTATLSACFEDPPLLTDLPPGCETAYPSIETTPYVVPFAVGMRLQTGLANCSASFHSAGQPDQFATDFDLPSGTPFLAARAGVVAFVQEDQPSLGGGSSNGISGNAVMVDHGDGTTALYLHSPEGGISVEVGDPVTRGDTLGVVGQSGLAGYPHLHFIVVEGSLSFPYQGVPVTFGNAMPADVPLMTYSVYEVLPY